MGEKNSEFIFRLYHSPDPNGMLKGKPILESGGPCQFCIGGCLARSVPSLSVGSKHLPSYLQITEDGASSATGHC